MKTVPTFLVRKLTVAVILALSTLPGVAITINWTNTTGGLWETPGNWNPNQAPSIGDSATFTPNASYLVYITNSTADSSPATMSMNTLSLGNGATDAPHLIFNYTNTPVIFHVTNTGVNAMVFGTGGSKPIVEILSGILVNDGTTKIGSTAGSDPQLRLNNSGVFSSVGSFQVAGAANSTGTVTVAGGTLYLTNGVDASDIWFGNGAGSLGSLIVSNGVVRIGSPSGSPTLAFGQNSSGYGQMLVSGGSVEIGIQTVLGANSAGTTGLVLLTGGKITATNLPAQVNEFDYFILGEVGSGTMIISNQGVLAVDRLGLGRNSTGVGLLTLTEGGRLEMAGRNYIQVGPLAGAVGTVSNINGGVIQFTTNNPALSIGNGTGAGYVINSAIEFKGVNAADLAGNVSTFFTYQGTNTLRLITATNKVLSAYGLQTNGTSVFAVLDLVSNSVFQATNLMVGAGAKVIGTGTLLGNNVTNLGTVAPGHSAGTLSFSSNLSLGATSVLDMEIAGTNVTAYDRIIVGGALTRTGAFNVSFLSYTPVGGEVFDFLDFNSASGTFSAMNLPSLGGGLQWDQSQFASQGILSIISPIPEPSAAMLLGIIGMAGFFLRRRKAEAACPTQEVSQ